MIFFLIQALLLQEIQQLNREVSCMRFLTRRLAANPPKISQLTFQENVIDKRALSPNRWSPVLRSPRQLFRLSLDTGVYRSESFILCNLGEAASFGIKSRFGRDRADAGHALHAAK